MAPRSPLRFPKFNPRIQLCMVASNEAGIPVTSFRINKLKAVALSIAVSVSMLYENLGRAKLNQIEFHSHLRSLGCITGKELIPMRVLLVEDERKVASFVARALRENSYAVDVAETGEKALKSASDITYDIILLDVRLPGLSGIEVCRELRQQGVDSPILMLTARSLVEQRVEGLDAGADDYLVKP